MTGRGKLLAAVTALEATFQHPARLGHENFKENKKEIIQPRRKIAALVSNVLAQHIIADEDRRRASFLLEGDILRH